MRLSNIEDTLHHLLHYLMRKSRVNFRWLCSELFSLAVCFIFLPRVYFLFADEMSLLPWRISFMPRDFFFYHELFLFWLREFLFCHEFSSFVLTCFFFCCGTCEARYFSLLSANFEIAKIAVQKNFQSRTKVMEFFFSKVEG